MKVELTTKNVVRESAKALTIGFVVGVEAFRALVVTAILGHGDRNVGQIEP